MPVFGVKWIPALPALLAMSFAATAGAQQKDKACEIDEGSPNQVARAVLDLQLAQSSGKPEDVANKLKDAVKLLNEGDMKKNPGGRAFELGKTLVVWMAQPGMSGGMTTRGAIGLQDNPTAPYDLIVGIDSAFTIAESSYPECAAQIAPWRQQKPWVDMINHAIELANQDKADSAAALAKRSLQLYKKAPYAYMVLAQVAMKNNQPQDVINEYKQALALMATDTAQADNRRQILMQLGNYTADLAEAATGTQKDSYLAEAKASYAALAKDPGTKFADAARAGQARIATLTGDTTAIRASYADQLANPGAFSYNSLMSAAVTAARAGQNGDALKLFEAAKATNPYHRDVLYNLARLYVLDSAYGKALPVARELISVDPSNPDNYQLVALAYAAIQKRYQAMGRKYDSTVKALGQRANTSKSASVQKAAIDSAARLNPFITAYGDSAKVAVDSALKYNDMMMKMPAKVSFSEFTATDAKTTLGGSITNQSDAEKTFTLKLQFVDKTGNVVATQDVSVGPVPAHGAKAFSTSVTGAGIVAFRYAPIS